MKLLQRREEQLQELFSIARSSILTFAEDEGRYSQFLEGAVVQGLLQLMEPKVTLLAREQDAEIMVNAGEIAAESYTRISGREISFELETTLSNNCRLIRILERVHLNEAFLSAGGIKLLNNSRRTAIDNTLDERLRLLEDSVSLAMRIHSPFSYEMSL